MLGNEIHFSDVRFGIKGDNPSQIIKNLAWTIGRETNTSPADTHRLLEKLLKTSIIGIGEGVAVFDWASDKIESPYLACARLESPVLFSAVDDRAIDIALTLVTPARFGPLHLQHLSRLTRMFRDPALLQSLRDVTCDDGMRSVLSPENRKFIAA